jgi:hypothetical protein
MLTNAKELSAFMISRAKNMTYVPAIHAIMGAEWENEKTLADRATYLKANIEPLLLEVFKDKHHFLLPRFVATMPAPPVMAGPDGKPQHLPGFDDAGMSAEDRDQIWAAIRRYSQNGKMGEPMIVKSERDWFNFGLSEREMLVRVNFMRIYMDEFFKRMPKTIPSPPKPPAEAELAIMRAAVLKHRKPGGQLQRHHCQVHGRPDFHPLRRPRGKLQRRPSHQDPRQYPRRAHAGSDTYRRGSQGGS